MANARQDHQPRMQIIRRNFIDYEHDFMIPQMTPFELPT